MFFLLSPIAHSLFWKVISLIIILLCPPSVKFIDLWSAYGSCATHDIQSFSVFGRCSRSYRSFYWRWVSYYRSCWVVIVVVRLLPWLLVYYRVLIAPPRGHSLWHKGCQDCLCCHCWWFYCWWPFREISQEEFSPTLRETICEAIQLLAEAVIPSTQVSCAVRHW